MKGLLLAISIILSSTGYTPAEKESCKTASSVTYMNDKEKEVVYYINLIRISPKKFQKEFLNPYLKKHPNYSKKYARSLTRDLKKTNPMPVLSPQKILTDFSAKHAKTTGKKGKVGHRSVRGKSYKKRTKKLVSKYKLVGENIHYGSKDPLEVVIDLLVDDGVKGVGHRENILNSSFKYIGVSFAPHKKYGTNCVMEFAGDKK